MVKFEEIVESNNIIEEIKKLKEEGNFEFKKQNFAEAEKFYQEGLIKIEKIEDKEDLKELMVQLYSNVSACYLKNSAYERAIECCTNALEINEKYVKCYFRRAKAYENLEKYEESLADLKKIKEIDVDNKEIDKDIKRLETLFQEKQKKDMEKMFSQLKDLGNTILNPFGLSTDNFNFQQNETGGYSMNFQNNK
eukprot:gene9926-2247_t